VIKHARNALASSYPPQLSFQGTALNKGILL
jgi:hypothetical protein